MSTFEAEEHLQARRRRCSPVLITSQSLFRKKALQFRPRLANPAPTQKFLRRPWRTKIF
jgi:hypothetical protein